MKDKCFRLVKCTKKDHICDICKINILAGSECISFTRVFEGENPWYIMKWICNDRDKCRKREVKSVNEVLE